MSTDGLPTRKRWQRAWHELGLAPGDDLYDAIRNRYAEPHRAYHGITHLNECLQHLDTVDVTGASRARIELALWFHDAIYDPHRPDNEKRSARWAHRALLDAGASRPLAGAVRDLVLATTHGEPSDNPDAQLVIDIDLAILGADAERFETYEEQIRREYGWVPGFVYRRKRQHVLRSFLDRPVIYSTPEFASRYERTARANLTRAIEALDTIRPTASRRPD